MKKEYKAPTITVTIFSFESIMDNMKVSNPENSRNEIIDNEDTDDIDW